MKIDWRSTVSALAILVGVIVFPLVNPCDTADNPVCSTDTQTNYYGLKILKR